MIDHGAHNQKQDVGQLCGNKYLFEISFSYANTPHQKKNTYKTHSAIERKNTLDSNVAPLSAYHHDSVGITLVRIRTKITVGHALSILGIPHRFVIPYNIWHVLNFIRFSAARY